MALATRCPACSTIFRISTAQAAAKAGMVRCGQCRNVFNSLDALVRVEDLDLVDEEVVEHADTTPAAVVVEAPAATVVDVAGSEPADEPDSEVTDVLASLSTPTEDHSGDRAWWMPDPGGRREPTATRVATRVTTPVSTTLHDPSPHAAIAAEARDENERTHAPSVAVPTAGGPDVSPWAAADGTGPVFMQPPRHAESASNAARWTWGTLSFVALALLVAQGAYLERDELAARWSPSRPWLVAACAMIGCRVDHPAHVESVTIESATIQTPAPDANLYVLTALLRNRDAIDVRYPYLELVLTDVQDRTVLRRVLRPEDYATLVPDDRGFASPGFAAQSELPVRLVFELNDLKFTGYRLDRFYP